MSFCKRELEALVHEFLVDTLHYQVFFTLYGPYAVRFTYIYITKHLDRLAVVL